MKLLGKKKILVFTASALCALAALPLSGCKKKDPPAAGAASDSATVRVTVTEVGERSFEDWGGYSAELRGLDDATLTAPVQGGRVNSVKEVGTRFKAGDPLANIDSEKYAAALEAAKAQVEVTSGDLERAKANVEKGSLGRAALDAANLAYQSARVTLAAAQRTYEDAVCQAPFDGIVTSRSIDRFQTVAPGAPTLRIARIDRLQAVIAIPEAEAFAYEPGMKAEFRLLQQPDKVYTGTVASRDYSVDSKSRTVTARIVIANGDGSLRPGMVGRANMLRHTYAHAVVVPSTAIVRLQNGVCVMVFKNGAAAQREVKIGAVSRDSTLISDGLSAGDTLITSGAFEVSTGTKVSFAHKDQEITKK